MYEIFEQLLSKYGVTAYKVAKETGITTATLSNWKQGKYTPKQDKLQKIADYFGVSLEYLMTGKEDVVKEKAPELSARDERDIKKDLDSLREKLANKEFGPAAYDGQDIPEEDIDLFLGQVDLMLRRVKIKNKEKYNPNKNKK
jgi:transcriptional regulator with XRE-family HTH domain